ncbi:hypothetical protein PGT21_024116 [Puccinia graminis f. sp. tritici]|uniref:Uncharacterized protein n=1 Tax=Puccinia graminis f. sp. tritici TaxID=56615 RepID=A0A5B0PLP5_PUCGR|nr:hypothetical protein PGT21_024116 [Puccinia graminis f. sp. tritici]
MANVVKERHETKHAVGVTLPLSLHAMVPTYLLLHFWRVLEFLGIHIQLHDLPPEAFELMLYIGLKGPMLAEPRGLPVDSMTLNRSLDDPSGSTGNQSARAFAATKGERWCWMTDWSSEARRIWLSFRNPFVRETRNPGEICPDSEPHDYESIVDRMIQDISDFVV